MTITVTEVWDHGVLINRTEVDDASPEEITVRDAVAQALVDLNTIQTNMTTIQGAALTLEADQISAMHAEATGIKQMSIMLERIIHWVDRRFLH